MGALFLMIDEELTNARPGRTRGTKYGLFDPARRYTAKDMAFWAQLASLFHDRIYVPANMLIDSAYSAGMIRELGGADAGSALRTGASPIRVLWDISRFQSRTFAGLLRELESDPSYVTCRDPKVAAEVAAFADEYLLGRTDYVSMAGKTDPRESVLQLRYECFNAARNAARIPHDRLREALDRVASREFEHGYGRNFYYSVFGYGETEAQKWIGSVFATDVRDVLDLKDEFLTSVDYVSNSLKARFASIGLQAAGRSEPVEVLMPPDYTEFVVTPQSLATRHDTTPIAVEVGERSMKAIQPAALLAMTAVQLAQIRGSDEFARFRAAVHEFRTARVEHLPPAALQAIESQVVQRTREYLAVIGRTLGVAPGFRDRAFTFSRVLIGAARLAVTFGWMNARGEGPLAPDAENAQLMGEHVEVAARAVTSSVVGKVAPADEIVRHCIRPTEEVAIYSRSGSS